jgi:hypothetical protein
MPDRYPFKKDFEPVVNVGEFLRLMPVDKYFEVEFVEPIPAIDHDFGILSAGQVLKDQELSFLYMPDNELAQYRMIPLDDIEITEFRQGKTPKWTTKDTSGYIPPASDYLAAISENLQLTEWYQFEYKTKAFITIRARSNVSTSRIRFYGYRFVLREVPKPPVFTTVWYEPKPRA